MEPSLSPCGPLQGETNAAATRRTLGNDPPGHPPATGGKHEGGESALLRRARAARPRPDGRLRALNAYGGPNRASGRCQGSGQGGDRTSLYEKLEDQRLLKIGARVTVSVRPGEGRLWTPHTPPPQPSPRVHARLPGVGPGRSPSPSQHRVPTDHCVLEPIKGSSARPIPSFAVSKNPPEAALATSGHTLTASYQASRWPV